MDFTRAMVPVYGLGLLVLSASVHGCHHVSKTSERLPGEPDDDVDNDPACTEAWSEPADPVDHASCSWSGYSGAPVAVWGTSSSNLFAAGNGGAIARFDGTNWSPMRSGTLADLTDIAGTSTSDVWAVGAAGTILHFDGATWSPAALPPEADETWSFYAVWAIGPDDVHVVGSRKLEDEDPRSVAVRFDGSAWSVTWDAASPTSLVDVWGSSPTFVIAAGKTQSLVFDGEQWQPGQSGTPSLFRVHGNGPDSVFGIRDMSAWRYDGSAWSALPELPVMGAYTSYFSLWISPEGTVLVGGEDLTEKKPFGVYFVFCLEGDEWAMHIADAPYPANIWGFDDDEVYLTNFFSSPVLWNGETLEETEWYAPFGANDLAGANGEVVYAIDNRALHRFDGQGWTRTDLPEWVTEVWDWGDWPSIWAAAPNDVFVVGYEGISLRFDGQSWTELPTGTQNHLSDAWGSAADDVFALGRNWYDDGLATEILHFDGQAWESHETLPGIKLYHLWGRAWCDVYAAGNYQVDEEEGPGLVLHYDGSAWNVLYEHSSASTLREIWSASPDDVYVAGPGLLHFDGQSWSQTEPVGSTSLRRVWGWSASHVFATASEPLHRLLHFDGDTWTSQVPIGWPRAIAGTSGEDLFIAEDRTLARWTCD